MAEQLSLVPNPTPPSMEDRRIHLVHGDASQMLRLARLHGVEPGRAIVLTDPPWDYVQAFGESRAENHYKGLTMGAIVGHLDPLAAVANRLVLWATDPTVWQFVAATVRLRKRGEQRPWWKWGLPVTSGGWGKSWPTAEADADELWEQGHYGQGHHWAGCHELVLQYTQTRKFRPHVDKTEKLRNLCLEPPGAHSRKPVGWQRAMIRRYTLPGDWILDPYLGLGSVAEAALLEGRPYIGTDVALARVQDAAALLAQVRP